MSKEEIGRIGQYRYGGIFYEEFLKELSGYRGAQVYKEMSENDDMVGAVLFAIENLIRQCKFTVEPASENDIDVRAAEFIEECMNDMEDTWTDTLSEILSFLTYGWSYHEIVYKRRMGKTGNRKTRSKYDDGLIGWRKLPIRAQETLWEWDYAEDSDDLLGMIQSPPPTYTHFTIPVEKALHFKTRSRKSNPEGRSILRNVYRSWYFKKRIQEIEGIGMERDLAGFPVLTGPEGLDLWDDSDEGTVEMLAAAENIVTNIRRDSREGLVLPNGWKLELLSAGTRRQFDTNATIERYDKRIAVTVLADFILLGQQGVGSFALSSDKTHLFSLAVGTYLDVICETFNSQGIPRLIDANGDHFKGITDYPKMVHSDIEEPDLTSLATFVTQLVGAGVLVPDESIEEHLRRVARLPEKMDTDIDGEATEGAVGADANPNDIESKSIYKVTSIIDKYQSNKLTRSIAANLLGELGLDGEKVEFYLSEADKNIAERKKAEEKDAKDAQKAKEKLGRKKADVE